MPYGGSPYGGAPYGGSSSSGATPVYGAVALASTAGLTVTGAMLAPRSVALTAAATLTTTGKLLTPRSVTVNATAGLTVTAKLLTPRSVALTSAASLTVTGQLLAPRAVSLTSAAGLTVTGQLLTPRSVALTAAAALTVSGQRSVRGSVSLAATAELTATGSIADRGAVDLLAGAGLTVSGISALHGTVALAATGALTATGTVIHPVLGSVTLDAAAGLTVEGLLAAMVPLVATASLTVSGSVVGPVSGEVDVTATASLTVSGAVNGVLDGAVSLSAEGGMTVSGTVTIPPLSPLGDPWVIRYLFTCMDPQGKPDTSVLNVIAEIPCSDTDFTPCINQSGSFSTSFSVEDPTMRYVNWVAATNPGKAFFWVDINGTIVYGGRIMQRKYQASTQKVSISGSDFYSYWAQRLQAVDYTTFSQEIAPSLTVYKWWKEDSGAPAPLIAWQILQDAVENPPFNYPLPMLSCPFYGTGSGLNKKNTNPSTWQDTSIIPTSDYITFSSQRSQWPTVDSLLQQFVQMGYPIGIELKTECSYNDDGQPTVQQYIACPRWGAAYADQQEDRVLVLDLSEAIDIEWTDDATSQATAFVEQSGVNGAKQIPEYLDPAACETNNYPLLEAAITNASVTPTALSDSVLEQMRNGDRALYVYPQLAPVITLPAYNLNTGFSLQNLQMGDDIVVYSPTNRFGNNEYPSIPFPYDGYRQVMRIVSIDVHVPDYGVPTMELTLNLPPASDPVIPGYATPQRGE